MNKIVLARLRINNFKGNKGEAEKAAGDFNRINYNVIRLGVNTGAEMYSRHGWKHLTTDNINMLFQLPIFIKALAGIRNGVPDLFVYKNRPFRFFFVEVKTFQEGLLYNQIRWFISHSEIPKWILYVEKNKEIEIDGEK